MKVSFRRPVDGCAECMNYKRRRKLIDGKWIPLGAVRCTHRGYQYRVGAFESMTLCWCCVTKILARGAPISALF